MKTSHLIPLAMLMFSALTNATSLEQGQTEFDNGNYRLAQSILQETKSSDVRKPLMLARIALKSDQPDVALQHIENAIQSEPKNAELYFCHAEVVAVLAEKASIFKISGYIKKLKRSFLRAVELAPDNANYRSALIKFYLNAPAMFGGDEQEAIKHIKQLEKIDPFAAHLARLHLYAKLDDKAAFAHSLETVSKDFGTEPELYYTLGIVYQEQKELEPALHQLRKAARMEATTPEQKKAKYRSLVLIGTISQQLARHHNEGAAALRQYLEEATPSYDMPDKSQIKFQLATIAKAQNQVATAQQLLQEVIAEALSKALKKKAQSALGKLAS
ncbi:hypothetical protein [Pseudoalteromonas sp. A757]|uniref:tetratricopeptide repeat protein n=1 Tax=Pseudoalteromonas sp. A757 TaxID=2250709 RepID=UPI000FFEDC92|nr:hypothetical protein [Pseudoalteromonas sp. A757]RXE85891.1 hypothetical protein DRB05_13235 [Pseudoalteromonas sp. A757]